MLREAQLRLNLEVFLIPIPAISTNEIVKNPPGARSESCEQASIGETHWRRRAVITCPTPTVDNVQSSTGNIRSVSAAMKPPGVKKACVTGPKLACGHGRCGACTVRLDGDLACACLVPAAAAAGSRVETVASLRGRTDDGRAGGLTDVQEAFLAAGATQCGYCTPGFVMVVTDLLARNPRPGREEKLVGWKGAFASLASWRENESED